MLVKFGIPEPPRFLYPRPELLKRLNQALEYPITLITAPAGYGKTTAVSAWMQSQAGARAWITLEPQDENPQHLLLTLMEGLRRSHPQLDDPLTWDTQAPSLPDQETLLTKIQAALICLPCQLVTVLDDCSQIESPPARRLLARFLGLLPPQAHTVILSRDPGILPLSRWRLRREILELDTRDLAFTSEELQGWLRCRLGAAPPDTDDAEEGILRRLHAQFEGWIAGLQLLALKLERDAAPWMTLREMEFEPEFLFDYLLEEVLETLPEDWKRFLLETCMLGTLHPDLCDAVGLRSNSSHVLHALHQAHLFLTPLEGLPGWYRFNPVFAEGLQGLLRRWEPSALTAAHRRAARWHLRRGTLEASLEHALSCADGETLDSLAARALENLFRNSDFLSLQRHLRRIPESLCTGRPWLSIFCAWAHFHTGRETDGEARLKSAEKMLSRLEENSLRSADETDAGSGGLWPHLLLLKGILLRLDGADEKALTCLQRAESLCPEESGFLRASIKTQTAITYLLSSRWDEARSALIASIEAARKAEHRLAFFGNVYSLTSLWLAEGQTAEALALAEEARSQAHQWSQEGGPAAGYASLAMAHWQALAGSRDEARRLALEGLEAGHRGGNIRVLDYGYSLLGRLCLEDGECEAGLAHIEQAETFGLRNRMHWAVDFGDRRCLRMLLQGPKKERASAEAWAQREAACIRQGHPMDADRQWTLSTLSVWKGKPAKGLEGLSRFADRCVEAGFPGAACRMLGEAMRWTEGEATGLVWNALKVKAEALRLRLGLADWSDPAPAPTAQEHGNSGALPLSRAIPTTEAARPEWELSHREVEVLQAMREGKSNKEIAGLLFVAPSTVKTHLKKIYLKLDVNNRLLAVNRALKAGILR